MAQTILIPTDFSIGSLQVLKEFLNKQEDNSKVNIIFAAGYTTSSSISDLLFFSKHRIIKTLNLDAFDDAVKIIENKYNNKVNLTKIEFFTGWNQRSFINFLEGNDVDQIIYSKEEQLKSIHKSWFDITPLVRKIKYKQTAVEVDYDIEYPREYIALSPLFSTRG
ncbi:hypothetical protein [Polluticaenibacter yanchengensis]|uniref:Uncharacterized protein n=1 Tax=Polluticaenibacter yanchengensis TaxID=3014562 RepID=A0ABT4UFV3_9BACT|nr:hypothetical protein [Chitinophagaceae bacterium LY-5]